MRKFKKGDLVRHIDDNDNTGPEMMVLGHADDIRVKSVMTDGTDDLDFSFEQNLKFSSSKH